MNPADIEPSVNAGVCLPICARRYDRTLLTERLIATQAIIIAVAKEHSGGDHHHLRSGIEQRLQPHQVANAFQSLTKRESYSEDCPEWN
jgi:hypothetical protein